MGYWEFLPAHAERVGRPRDVCSLRNKDRVVDAVLNDSNTSVRKLERRLQISRTSINRITRARGLHPFHATRVQKLEPGDFERRIALCNRILEMDANDPDFRKPVLWTDKSLFTCGGRFNQHNSHQYALENPHYTRDHNFQNKWKIKMWGDIVGNVVILHPLPDAMNVSRKI